MMALEAMGIEQIATETSVQYVDHNLLQQDARAPDDHLFLRSACRRFGVWYSGPGNGVSHPTHMESFGRPGQTLVGSDSHTCAAGSMGMLAIGAGGLEVAMAMAGEPFVLQMPEVWGVRLEGKLRPWVSAKDVILELLRRYGVSGGRGRILEFHGPGVETLTAMDRHVIANMGAELGATSTVFPADEQTRTFLSDLGREHDFRGLSPEEGAEYDIFDHIDLSEIDALIAIPPSPGNVRRVREVSGQPIHQAYIGSSANPGYRDFAVAANIVRGRQVEAGVSFDINPSTRRILSQLSRSGALHALLNAGARLHQVGCNGCIGMGQAPASGRASLRTVPRNFPGRSGTADDQIYLCSPETAAMSAVFGKICDPEAGAEELGLTHGQFDPPISGLPSTRLFEPPLEPSQPRPELIKGAHVESLPPLAAVADQIDVPVISHAGDDLSTDEILPAGARTLPFRSAISKLAQHCFRDVDKDYLERAKSAQSQGGHAILAGHNYGQGSSREHAALAPRTLGLIAVLARSFARIHHANLINFGVLPLEIGDAPVPESFELGARLEISGVHRLLTDASHDEFECRLGGHELPVRLRASRRSRDILRAGGLVNWYEARRSD